MQVQEVWEDGQAHHQISAKLQALAQQREEVEAARKVRNVWDRFSLSLLKMREILLAMPLMVMMDMSFSSRRLLMG